MKLRRREPTKEELILKHALEVRGVRVLLHVKDGYKTIDLAIPSANINIEVDGKHHLTNPHQIISDLARSHYSGKLGYDTVHIPNIYIHLDIDKIANALAEAAEVREKKITQGMIA